MPNLENFSASGRAKALSNPVVRKCPILEVTEAKKPMPKGTFWTTCTVPALSS